MLNEFVIALMLALVPIPTMKCGCDPKPHLHAITGEDGSTVTSADCGKGWKVHLTPEATQKYNKLLTQAAGINLLADASCEREETK